MVFFLSTILFANASAIIHSSTSVEGEGTTKTFIQTTVNGDTTTVESNRPGTVRVEKTDTTETIASDNPVTVFHGPATSSAQEATKSSGMSEDIPVVAIQNYWIAFIRSLWDRMRSIFLFDVLTRK